MLVERQEDVHKFMIAEAEKRDRAKEAAKAEKEELDSKFVQLMKDRMKVKAEEEVRAELGHGDEGEEVVEEVAVTHATGGKKVTFLSLCDHILSV